ncbi:MAG: biopolymer transport protein ExbD [Rhodobacteraceae bacterium HLUCCA12]|nr:MAG: biopolymer transport protein ExbD [Rhodobacteraceae bacterium HLUCCA12]
MITLGEPRQRRRMSLAPMIDVVFLLLIFFMLAARFAQEGVLALSGAGTTSDTDWRGPPRLVEFAPQSLWLNGVAVALDDLPTALEPLMQGPNDPVILQPRPPADLQDLADLTDRLHAAGLTRLILVEP